MKKLTAWGLVALAVAVLLWSFSSHTKARVAERRNVLETRAYLEEKAKRVSTERVESVFEKLQKMTRLEDLEDFGKTTAALSKEERDAINPVLRAKLFEANFRRAELYLLRAGNLLRADKNHPAGKEYVGRARKLYEKMEKLMEAGIPERPNSSEENARLNYLKGVYYFRQLVFIQDPKKEAARIGELVGQSAGHLSAVFKDKPRDRDAEVALEILQKKEKEMGASNGSEVKMQLDLLPSEGQGQGPTFAIEGSEEGRH